MANQRKANAMDSSTSKAEIQSEECGMAVPELTSQLKFIKNCLKIIQKYISDDCTRIVVLLCD